MIKHFRVLILFFLIAAPSTIPAATMYIKEIKISVRSDQEMSGNNIVAFVQTGQEVDELKNEGIWSYVRLPNGKEGWIRNQYLSAERPKYVSIDTVQKDCEKLVIQSDTLNEDNKLLKDENQRLKSLTLESEKRIAELEKAYETLKSDSKDVFKLQTDLKKAIQQRDEERSRAEKFEKQATAGQQQEKYKWFLTGAGVLFAGVILGSVLKRQKRKSFY